MSVIDNYLNTVAAEQKTELDRIRSIIQQTVPEVEEALSYGMPTFKYEGRPLIGFTASKNHLSIHPFSPSVIIAVKDKLEDYELSKGTIRFLVSAPILESILVEIINHRLTEIISRRRPTREAHPIKRS